MEKKTSNDRFQIHEKYRLKENTTKTKAVLFNDKLKMDGTNRATESSVKVLGVTQEKIATSQSTIKTITERPKRKQKKKKPIKVVFKCLSKWDYKPSMLPERQY